MFLIFFLFNLPMAHNRKSLLVVKHLVALVEHAMVFRPRVSFGYWNTIDHLRRLLQYNYRLRG